VSVFEFLLALYAIVAGLGVSLLVRSVGQMIEARDRVRLYWVHTCWIALIFVGHVVSWFALWRYADHAPWTILQALLLLCVPIFLYLISHLAVPELDDDRRHYLRDYYYRHARWTQGLLLAVLVAGALAHFVIEGQLDLTGARGVRAAMGLILVPGIISRHPTVHAVQAALLLLVMLFAASYVAQPVG
jgi:surface polysaccharide O-acyltransferase-like enzyme